MDKEQKGKKSKGAKTSKPKPAKKPKSGTVLDKIVFAIRSLQSGPKGSSRAAIAKYLKSEFEYENANALKTALKKGGSNGTLIQTGQSFRVAADPVEESPEEETIQKEDVSVGEGDRKARHGDEVTVAYEGKLDDGYQFDKASKFKFLLGAGEVIKGWDMGVEGMREGGKRKLVVPSKLGYGKRGCKPDIPPDATLHFVVKLKKIKAENR
mmetsp:Transcript_50657/g.152587  ORF Transcript_50657/g.152587 Transcript_50657/m.152587 type:complete len:210 (-) Transcript_50657:346-975(-)